MHDDNIEDDLLKKIHRATIDHDKRTGVRTQSHVVSFHLLTAFLCG